jgi:tetratricopeptide (TPR) repeat protein
MDRIVPVLHRGLFAALLLAMAGGFAHNLSAAEGPELGVSGPGPVLQYLPSVGPDASNVFEEMPATGTEAPVSDTDAPVSDTENSVSDTENLGLEAETPVLKPEDSTFDTADRAAIDHIKRAVPPLPPTSPSVTAVSPSTGAQTSRRHASRPTQMEAGRTRSEQLEQVAQQADCRTRHGYELAGRGALFAARAEFLGAIQLVAEALDAETRSDRHGRALTMAVFAMKEAEDFLPNTAQLGGHADLSAVIALHGTPVLKDTADKVTSLEALQSYFTFAQEQFAAAVGQEVAGSMALHALGKLHAALARNKASSILAPESKAMVFYQAALLAYHDNHAAANDLGVLLALCGHYGDARKILERSVCSKAEAISWRNLALVYRQLGEPVLADRAAEQVLWLRRSELAQRRTAAVAGNDRVRWIDPQTFARTSTGAVNPPGPAGSAAPGRVAVRQAAPMMSGTMPIAAEAPSPRYVAPTPAAAARMSRTSRSYQR